MTRRQRFKKKVHDYLFDHQVLRVVLEYSYTMIVCVFSAFCFAFGFSTFAKGTGESLSIITGGASGLAQSLRMIIELFVSPEADIFTKGGGVALEAIFYSVVNIPLIIFAFKKVGVRFAALTLINVFLTSLFMPYVRENPIFQQIANDPSIASQPLTRGLFAGVCTGVSTALAFKGLFSTGGLDIISYYISNKKSNGAGKYSGILNIVNITIYTILFICSINIYSEFYKNSSWTEAIVSFIYGLVYLVSVMVVVDLINVRNKKVQVQIVTKEQHLADVLIANLPHSVTITKAVGGYSHSDRYILLMTISSFELKKVVKVVQGTDPCAFVQALSLHNVYGNFYMTPIK